jgi:glycosyltransferase involved in cell wall biosynthesis
MRSICFITFGNIAFQYPTVKSLADHLVRQGLSVDIFTRYLALKREIQENRLFRVIGYRPLLKNLQRTVLLEFMTRAFSCIGEYDAYVGVDEFGLLGAYVAAKRHGAKPLIAYMLELHCEPNQRWIENSANSLISKTDALIDVDSGRLLHRIQRWPTNAETFVIPNVPSLQFLHEICRMKASSNGDPIIWYHGSLSPEHGIDHLLDGFALVQTPSELHLTGDCPDPTYRRSLLSRIQSSTKPIFLHPPAPVHTLLTNAGQKADIAVVFYPFRRDPSNLNLTYANSAKLFEYMALGIPVIASDNTSFQNLVQKNHCGVCVPPEDPKSVANAIDLLLVDRNLRKSLSDNGVALFLSTYHLEQQAQPFLEWLSSAICPVDLSSTHI